MLRCRPIMRRFITALALCIPLLLSSASSFSQGAPTFRSNRVLTHREQAPLQARWIEQRFKTVLPALMRRERIDMWIVVSREYNDDPVFRSMSPVTTYSSRRRTILVFFDRGDNTVEHLSIGRFDYDGLFTLEKTHNDGQWAGLPTPAPANGHVIQRGDMLHCDFGIVYLGFSTDTQHNAYVLRVGETDAPQGLKDGLKEANRLQQLTMQFAKPGATGNQALLGALGAATREGLAPSIYCHPIGYHGHAAGPPIGMTDYQDGVPGRGDYMFRPNTWHSIELNVKHNVPEWGNQPVQFALEEDAALLDTGWAWIAGPQTQFYLIK